MGKIDGHCAQVLLPKIDEHFMLRYSKTWLQVVVEKYIYPYEVARHMYVNDFMCVWCWDFCGSTEIAPRVDLST